MLYVCFVQSEIGHFDTVYFKVTGGEYFAPKFNRIV